MNRVVLALAALASASSLLVASDGKPQSPPLPDREPAAAKKNDAKPTKVPGAPSIRLGEKRESDQPHEHGVGEVTKGKFEVEAEGGALMAVVTGAAYAHHALAPSLSAASIQLVQEFEIVPGNPEDPRVLLAMGAKLDGYIRSEKKGCAILRRADATIYPAGGGPCVGIAFPPAQVSGDKTQHIEGEDESPPRVVPAGRYLLVVNLVLETTADGFLPRSHAETVFAPGHRTGTWNSKDSPPPDLEGDDFGLAVTVHVVAPLPG